MDEEKLIQVSLQLPSSALDSVSRLAEQLRLLAEAASARSVSAGRTAEHELERMENSFFRPEQFRALQQAAGMRESAPPTVPDTAYAKAAFSTAQERALGAESAGAHLDSTSEGNRQSHTLDERQGIQQEIQTAAPSSTDAVGEAEIPAVRTDVTEQIPNAREAGQEAERQVPNAESAQMETAERALTPATIQAAISGGIETPLGAGIVVQSQLEQPQSRWSGVTEELVVPGPAPLTAEAVSLAFERDGRRYDNGFPLY